MHCGAHLGWCACLITCFGYLLRCVHTHEQVMGTYIEIYNERMRDLLEPDTTTITLQETPSGGVSLKGVATRDLRTVNDLVAMLVSGERHRTVDSHRLNEASSRSHAVLQLVIRVFGIASSESAGSANLMAKLTLCDLAGSERTMINAPTASKKMQREGSEINKSLLALGNCINALSSRTRQGRPAQYDPAIGC